MKITTRGRLAALMTATSVATGVAGGFASQAQAVGTPAASYQGQQHSGQERALGGMRHGAVGHEGEWCSCGPTSVVTEKISEIGSHNIITNQQTLLPILNLILPTTMPTTAPTTTTTKGS
ncbi:hypothetical protein [Streptomyces jumonjinensis]|uniref:hypothetical protein n=1 Tax=Streptomyces jumonjinensis TaxID=1945 RepID=UPI0037A474B8